MTRQVLTFLLSLMGMALVWASTPLTATSKLRLHRHDAVAGKHAPQSSGEMFQAFIRVDGEEDLSALRTAGVKVNARFDNFVTVQIPASAMTEVMSMTCVREISFARPLSLHNDSARSLSCIDRVHDGQGMVAPLTGRGVIVGIIDTGIDFNHVNLCGIDGKTRVKAVYMPCDTTGPRPVVGGDTLPGSCYESPDMIAMLTTDFNGTSHGTHTLGTAAGSYRANGWYGVATEADLVACGMPGDSLSDANVANALKYIFDYADRVNKPCVVNMSIGTNEGPNNGTSFMCRTFEALSGPGRICVLSAGNDGNVPVRFNHRLAGDGDVVTTLMRGKSSGTQHNGYVSMWSDGASVHRSRLVAINRGDNSIGYASPWIGLQDEDSVFTLSSEVEPDFARFFTGEVQFASAMEPQFNQAGDRIGDRFHSFWIFDATISSDYLLGLQYTSSDEVELVGWSTKDDYFDTFGIDGMVGGSTQGSISDLATTDSVISVGAYCSRKSYYDSNNELYTYNRCTPDDIAYFSSYGPDESGIERPDLCAPGFAVISSANRYHDSSHYQHMPPGVTVSGVEYPYSVIYGTSMSAPVVTGVIAMMLQLNPSLTVSDVREAFRASSVKDAFVTGGDHSKWGFGKLDAWSAVDAVIGHCLLPGDVNNDREVNIADVMAIVDILLRGNDAADASTLVRADVNHDLEILFSDINYIINLILQ